MKRRVSILLAAVLAASMMMTACSGGDGGESKTGADEGGKEVEIRMGWWGGNTRNDYMNAMLDLYEEENPGVTVTREYCAWNDYWTKYATQAATGTSPDVVEHTMMTLGEYVAKDVVRPLDEFVESGLIDMSDFSQAAIDAGNYQGKQYMILFGMTVNGILYNKTLLEEYGCELPPSEWTMDEMHEYLKGVRAKVPEDVFIFESDCGYQHVPETYARSIGKSLYNEDGTGFGMEKQDMINLFQYWEDLRADNLVAPPINQEESFALPQEQCYISTGKALFKIENTNILQTFWLNEAGYEIYLAPHPTYDGKSGDFLQPTAFCISTTAPDEVVEPAAKLINWLVNDVEGNKLFHEDLGMPGAETVAAALDEEATEPIKVFHEFMETSILPKVSGVDFRPQGSDEVLNMYKLKYQEVGSGQKDIETAVDEIYAEAEKMLSKNK